MCSHIKKITKNFIDELFNEEKLFKEMIELFLCFFEVKEKEILYHLLKALNRLCKAVVLNENDQSNILSSHMEQLCDRLLKICSSPDLYDKDNNIISISFHLLGTLGERAALDVKDKIIQYFETLNYMFKRTLNEKYFQNRELANLYQEYLAFSLSSFLDSKSAKEELVKKLLFNIIESFKIEKVFLKKVYPFYQIYKNIQLIYF